MKYLAAPLEKLIEQFEQLPGIGHKSAQRLAFHVLGLPEAEAQEFADAYLPMQAIFAAETIHTPYTEFSNDGVHPNAGGAGFIAQHLLNTIAPIIEGLNEQE